MARKLEKQATMNTEYSEISVPMPWGHVAGRWYGDQSKRPLLAIHGWLDNCGTYARLAPLLQPYTSILCIDLPGHGHSTHLPVGMIYHNMEFVRVILRLMKSYKWEKVSLMGHSMGGGVAFAFTALYPDLVDMLVQFDFLIEPPYALEFASDKIQDCIERAEINNERILESTPMDEPPSYTYEECKYLLYKGSEYSVPIENCKYLLERNLAKSVKYPNKYYFSRDARLKYRAIFNHSYELSHFMGTRICRAGVPHLLIQGGASTNAAAATIIDHLSVFKTQSEHFEHYIIPHGTHHLHLNNPNEIAEIVIDFWKRKNWLETKELNDQVEDDSTENLKSKL